MPEVICWNPRQRLGTGPISRRISSFRRIRNFGDLLGPVIVDRIHRRLALGDGRSASQRLLTVGSVLREARVGDVVWGSGVNGKSMLPVGGFPPLDVRAVRGPLTRALLQQADIVVPAVFGDPALLLPLLWSDEELGVRRGSGGLVLVPHFRDRDRFPGDALDPRGDPLRRVREIASAERVVTSSLHALVVAEAYGVPAVPVVSNEPLFKYRDYYEGTGRPLPRFSSSVAEALVADAPPGISAWDPTPLLEAFPRDLWTEGPAI